MEDIIEIGKTVSDAGSLVVLLGFLVVLSIPKLKKRVFGNGEIDTTRIEELEAFKLQAENNHFHDIEDLKEDIKEIKRTLIDVDKRVVRLETKLGNGKNI